MLIFGLVWAKITSLCSILIKSNIAKKCRSGKLEFVLILLEFCRMKRHTAANMYLQTSFPYRGSVIAPIQCAKIDKEA